MQVLNNYFLFNEYLAMTPCFFAPEACACIACFLFVCFFWISYIHTVSTRPVQTNWSERWSCMETLHSFQMRRKRRRRSQRYLMKLSSRIKQRARRLEPHYETTYDCHDLYDWESSQIHWGFFPHHRKRCFILFPSLLMCFRVRQWPNLEAPRSSGILWGLWDWMTRTLPGLPMLNIG